MDIKFNDNVKLAIVVVILTLVSIVVYNVQYTKDTLILENGTKVKLGEVYQQQVTHHVKVESSYYNANYNGSATALSNRFNADLKNLKSCDYNSCSLSFVRITLWTEVSYRSENFPLFPYTVRTATTTDRSAYNERVTPVKLNKVLGEYISEMQKHFEDNFDAM